MQREPITKRPHVTLQQLHAMEHDAAVLNLQVIAHLGDEAMERAMKLVVVRLQKYVQLAMSRKTQVLTLDEITKWGAEGEEGAGA